MGRFFLEIQYNGTNYHGWQIQKNAHSVQAEINTALSIFLQEKIEVLGCGRTDTGVHAKQFFAHFDTQILFEKPQLIYKLNCLLPNDISCKRIIDVTPKLHARYSPVHRTYQYWVTQQKNPFYSASAFYVPTKLNVDFMNDAAKRLIRQTDFSCFSKSRTNTTTNICDVRFAKWELKEDLLVFTIIADRFLRNMVRAIVGTLIEIGQEKISINEIDKILISKKRSEAGTSVPAHGLYLTEVKYDTF